MHHLGVQNDQIGCQGPELPASAALDGDEAGIHAGPGAGSGAQFIQRRVDTRAVDNHDAQAGRAADDPLPDSRQVRCPLDHRILMHKIGGKIIGQTLRSARHQTGQPSDRRGLLMGFRIHRRPLEGNAHIEGGALARHAVQRDITTHHSCQLAGDGQSQPGATKTPGSRVIRLHEWFKQTLLGLFTHADTVVGDMKLQRDPFWRALSQQGAHRHPALPLLPAGELDGVVDQVEQYLAQPSGIAHDL